MTLPLWTLLAAILLPYVWFGVASGLRKKELGMLDNQHPRIQEAKVTGIAARAQGASDNAFEALAVYAPAVLMAHVLAPGSALAPVLALVWFGARVLHAVTYISGKPTLRTMLFAVGSACAIGFILVGAHVL